MKDIQSLYSLEGDVAVVTGAGRGIGEGIAKVFAAAGAAVVCAARREAEIERVAKEIRASGGKAIAVPTDVTDSQQLHALADTAISTFGSLNIWVNNAGGSPVQMPLAELPESEWQATIALNLTAVWQGCSIASRRLADGGRIINISSLAAEMIVPGSGHYAAAKAGVNVLTRNFAQELGPRIRVNGIMPGMVPTEIAMKAMRMTDDDLPKLEKMLRLPAGRLGTPEDLGAAALFLASPGSAWVTGQVIQVSGGP